MAESPTKKKTNYNIEKLRNTQIFDGISLKTIEKISGKKNNSENLEEPGLYEDIFDYEKDGKNLSFMIILEGCLAVVAKNDKDISTIDALLTPGQVIGEFELLGFTSTGQRLQTISTNTTLISFDIEAITQQLTTEEQLLFFKNLSKTLVYKLKTQANWIKIRNFSSITKRLGSLLDYFNESQNWKQLTKTNDNGYDIDVVWSLDLLCKCLSTSMQSLPEAIQDLLTLDIITVDEVENLDKPNELTKFPKNFFTKNLKQNDKNRCLKIKVINKRKLSSGNFEIPRKKKKTKIQLNS
jgi:CRP-like cAMP-binding protein